MRAARGRIMPAIEQRPEGVLVHVVVTPKASRNRIGPRAGDRLKIAVRAPPERGAANTAVAELVAEALGCRRREVKVVKGHTSRQKTVLIAGGAVSRVAEALE